MEKIRIMKKLIANIAIAAGVIVGMSSCEDFLDKVPTDSVVATSAMVTMDDARVAANGLYVDLKTTSMYASNMVYFGDMRGDNIYPLKLSGTGHVIYTHNFAPGQNHYFGMWQNYYNLIMKASTYINNVNTIETANSSEEAQFSPALKAIQRFLRTTASRQTLTLKTLLTPTLAASRHPLRQRAFSVQSKTSALQLSAATAFTTSRLQAATSTSQLTLPILQRLLLQTRATAFRLSTRKATRLSLTLTASFLNKL